MKFISIPTSLAVALAVFIFAGCASTSSGNRLTGPLTIIKTGANAGKISHVSTRETDQRLYVSATVKLGPFDYNANGAHLVVDLLDTKGRVIASDKDKLPWISPRRRQTAKQRTLHGSFTLSQARRASAVRVNYVSR